MTEDEAKTKLCHKTIDGHGVFEPGATFLPKYFCAGSACMAWRWGKKFHRSKKTGVLLEESHHFRNDPDFELVVHGFCGLAGRP